MAGSVETYLSFMFWYGVFAMVVRSLFLISDHPRKLKPIDIGADVIGFVFSVAMLAWVSVLRSS